ncbi:MAG: hypothetical protein ACX94C_00050 [Phycisphaerales bacterium]
MYTEYESLIEKLPPLWQELVAKSVDRFGPRSVRYVRYDAAAFGNCLLHMRVRRIHFQLISDRCEVFIDYRLRVWKPWIDLNPVLHSITGIDDRSLDAEQCTRFLIDAIEVWNDDKWKRFRKRLR